MSILSGKEIEAQVAAGRIVIDPYDPAQVNENSYNLRLGKKLLLYDVGLALHRAYTEHPGSYGRLPLRPLDRLREDGHWPDGTPRVFWGDRFYAEQLDMAVEPKTTLLEIPEEGMFLFPGVLYLGHTLEYTETYRFSPYIEGRSSVGRLGMQIHETAGFGETGFKGTWTLEISVIHPLRVYAGVKACQIVYSTVLGEQSEYHGKYVGQREPRASRLWTELQDRGK